MKALLLFRCLMVEMSKGKEFDIVRYVKPIPPLDEGDETFRCARLQWTTAGLEEQEQDVEKKRKERDAVTASEQLRVVGLQCIVRTVHSVQANVAVQLFTMDIP